MKANLRQYLSTDMAAELYRSAQTAHSHPACPTGNPLHDSGIEYQESDFDGIRREKLVIATAEASDAIGKSIGTYYTVHTGNLQLHTERAYTACQAAIRASLLDAAAQLCPDFRLPTDGVTNHEIGGTPADHGFANGSVLPTTLDDAGEGAWDRLAVSPEWDQGAQMYNAPPAALTDTKAADTVRAEGEPLIGADADRTAVTDIPPVPASDLTPFRPMTILAVGLGNPGLTPDALGPMTVSHLHVTRHLTDGSIPAFDSTVHKLCAVTPLVLGQTGIETLELVRGAVRAVEPDLVILIDALAASEIATLTMTVQISTTGIHPGGGVGNKRQALDRDSLGVPVMTVGVPTVIASSALICRVLEDAEVITEDTDASLLQRLHRALSDGDIGYVAPKDIDADVTSYARLIADAVNALALGHGFQP